MNEYYGVTASYMQALFCFGVWQKSRKHQSHLSDEPELRTFHQMRVQLGMKRDSEKN